MKKIKLGAILVLILLVFSNCNYETSENAQAVSATTKLLSGIKEENISLDEIKKDYYLSPILKNTSKKLKQNTNNLKNQNLFNLDLSNRVKKYILNDYTSYTIAIINDSGNSYIFQNLVIEKDALRDAAYLVTYYPDENYKESIQKHLVNPDDNIDFTGSKTIEYLYYKRKVNIDKTTANTNKGTIEIGSDGVIDEPLTICVTTYTPKQCTAGGNHSPGQSCTGTTGQQPGWIVSESCTPIPRPTDPGPGPYPGGCKGCVTTPTTPSQGSGAFFPPTSPSPDWTPEFICVATGPGGACTKVIPYTPILTIPMYDPYNYYTTVLSREEIDLLLRAEYQDARKSIDFYLESNKTLEGGYTRETGIFVSWTLDYFKNNRDTTFEQFENWFMGTSEGTDGDYDVAYWENPNLIFQQQNLPTFENFKNACPSKYTNAETLCTNIGGEVLKMYNDVIASGAKLNTCAIRMSKAFNDANVIIPSLPDNPNGTKNTIKDKDGRNYIINAKALNTWMKKTFGTSPSNYQHYDASKGGNKGEFFPSLLTGKNGIYTMVARDAIQKDWGSGHADLLENGSCLLNCHFYDITNQFVPVKFIDVWYLN
jgi:hypothetical protein